jgi:hypothetical protein
MTPANPASPRSAAVPSQPAPLSDVRQQEFRVPASCKVLLGAMPCPVGQLVVSCTVSLAVCRVAQLFFAAIVSDRRRSSSVS